jgi:hypothetical protein
MGIRTTLTLDDDVAELLREEMYRSNVSMKQAVNQALRQALRSSPCERKPYRTRPLALDFKPGVDLDRMNQLADELEAEAFQDRYLSEK